MSKKSILFVLLGFVVFVACDCGIHEEGQVFDKSTNKGLENVAISVLNRDTVYTDSLGNFDVHTVLHGSTRPDVYLLFTKENYKPCLIKTSNQEKKILSVPLEPIDSEFKPLINPDLIPWAYWINLILMSLVCIGTGIFILRNKKIKKRIFWIIGIFLLNPILGFSYIDGTLISTKLINIPPFLEHYWRYPFSIQILIPVVVIFFWILYCNHTTKRFICKSHSDL